MATNIVSHVSHSGSVEENRLAMRVTTELKKQEAVTLSWRQIWKWFGILSTLSIGAAALVPDAFGIPAGVQPWVFLTAIFWVFAFCAGMFNL
jgi:hypothetical protein